MSNIRYYAPEPEPDDVYIVGYDKSGNPVWSDYEGPPVEMQVVVSDDSNSLELFEEYDFSIPL